MLIGTQGFCLKVNSGLMDLRFNLAFRLEIDASYDFEPLAIPPYHLYTPPLNHPSTGNQGDRRTSRRAFR